MKGCFNALLIDLTCADFFFSVGNLAIDKWGLLNPLKTYYNWPFELVVHVYFFTLTFGSACYGAIFKRNLRT